MKVTYPLSLVLLVLGLAACGGSVEPINLQGIWSGGGATDSGQGFTLALNVTEVSEDGGGQLVGATAVFNGDLENAVEMSGAFGGGSLTLRSQGGANQATLQLAISMSGSSMEGQGSFTSQGGEIVQLTFVLAKNDSVPDPPPPPPRASSRFGTEGRSSCSPPPPGDDLRGTWSGNGSVSDGTAFSLTLEVTRVDAASGSVSATATVSEGLQGSVETSGTFDGTNLSLSSDGGGITLSITVSGTTMDGQGSLALDDGGTAQFTFTLTKGGGGFGVNEDASVVVAATPVQVAPTSFTLVDSSSKKLMRPRWLEVE